ncbi:hypothetical protein KOW79_007837 [Hemibagrus wyckioides]|uniref:Uncharacterized protein n=1 Tax=Hemibagrus wyckioides TaxID=337641 RepID=A0A9D3NRU4_9TELE|nr:hypothetical protein KOW79_007837 [Hemibagrus wyckioides]
MQLLRDREKELDADWKKLDLAAPRRKPVPLPRKFCPSAAASSAPTGTDVSITPASPLAPLLTLPVNQCKGA